MDKSADVSKIFCLAGKKAESVPAQFPQRTSGLMRWIAGKAAGSWNVGLGGAGTQMENLLDRKKIEMYNYQHQANKYTLSHTAAKARNTAAFRESRTFERKEGQLWKSCLKAAVRGSIDKIRIKQPARFACCR